jgi:hypothetical protein
MTARRDPRPDTCDVHDPNFLWQEIMDLARWSLLPPDARSSQGAEHALTVLGHKLRAMHRHLTRDGRFPSIFTDSPRLHRDGPSSFIAGKVHEEDVRKLIFEVRGEERQVILAMPLQIRDELAADILGAIRDAYEQGRKESWQERTS